MNSIVKFIAPIALLGLSVLPAIAQTDIAHHGVNGRLHEQHRRIEQGERSGALTGREAHRLEVRDARIHRQERRDRMANDGKLTTGEHRRLENRLNRTSGAIYNHKHDIGTH